MNYSRQIFVCCKDGSGFCGEKGGTVLLRLFREKLVKKNITNVMVTSCGCTGPHRVGPIVIVHPDGIWYNEVKPEDVEEIITSHIIDNRPVGRLINREVSVGGMNRKIVNTTPL